MTMYYYGRFYSKVIFYVMASNNSSRWFIYNTMIIVHLDATSSTISFYLDTTSSAISFYLDVYSGRFYWITSPEIRFSFYLDN